LNLTKQQVITKINSSKNVDALKLDADENTALLIRKLDEKVRIAKLKLQKNEDVTVVFIS
jgi:cell envelope opacity-associated protein A